VVRRTQVLGGLIGAVSFAGGNVFLAWVADLDR
jgi:hypothetical protein